MIKTLRITSITAFALAGAFFVISMVFGLQGDKGSEEFLRTAGVIEQFSKGEGRKKTKQNEKDDSPLVKQAEAFALYLNPPKPKEPAGPVPGVGEVSRPRTVTPKFELVGTSFYASNPQLSLALIDEPGKGLRWVRQSSEIGHLVIEQVKDGAVVVRDGERTFELVAERPRRINLVKSSSIAIEPSLPDSNKSSVDVAVEAPAEPPTMEEEIANLEEALRGVKLMRMDVTEGGDSNQPEGEEAAAMEEFISKLEDELKTMRISAEEAKKLEDLGKELQDIQEGPNRPADSNSDVNEGEANRPNE